MRDDARIRVSVGPRPATAKDFCWQFTHSVRGCVCGERGKYNQQKRRYSPGGWRVIIIIIVTHFTAMVGLVCMHANLVRTLGITAMSVYTQHLNIHFPVYII